MLFAWYLVFSCCEGNGEDQNFFVYHNFFFFLLQTLLGKATPKITETQCKFDS